VKTLLGEQYVFSSSNFPPSSQQHVSYAELPSTLHPSTLHAAGVIHDDIRAKIISIDGARGPTNLDFNCARIVVHTGGDGMSI
jgi:hypothetical protein